MRKSVILFIILFAYIYGCSGGEEDKYNLLSKQDKKTVKTLCKCIEPLTPYFRKIMNIKDSAEAMIYLDSIEIKSKEIADCVGGAALFEDKFTNNNDKYIKQLFAYIKEKYPDCLPFFEGIPGNSDDSIK